MKIQLTTISLLALTFFYQTLHSETFDECGNIKDLNNRVKCFRSLPDPLLDPEEMDYLSDMCEAERDHNIRIECLRTITKVYKREKLTNEELTWLESKKEEIGPLIAEEKVLAERRLAKMDRELAEMRAEAKREEEKKEKAKLAEAEKRKESIERKLAAEKEYEKLEKKFRQLAEKFENTKNNKNIINLLEKAKSLITWDFLDPEAAKFRSVFIQPSCLCVCGEVSGKNLYGGYTGYRKFLIEYDPNNFSLYSSSAMILEKKLYSTENKDDNFINKVSPDDYDIAYLKVCTGDAVDVLSP